jgi:hypothetical protein
LLLLLAVAVTSVGGLGAGTAALGLTTSRALVTLVLFCHVRGRRAGEGGIAAGEGGIAGGEGGIAAGEGGVAAREGGIAAREGAQTTSVSTCSPHTFRRTFAISPTVPMALTASRM